MNVAGLCRFVFKITQKVASKYTDDVFLPKMTPKVSTITHIPTNSVDCKGIQSPVKSFVDLNYSCSSVNKYNTTHFYYTPTSQGTITINKSPKVFSRVGARLSEEEKAVEIFVKSENLRQNGIKKIIISGKETEFIVYTGGPKGSNCAFWAKSQETGELFYVKYGAAGQSVSEHLTTKLYKLAGIDVPTTHLGKLEDGTVCLTSKFKSGLSELSSKDISEIETGFAADAWLANWDALLNGNTLLKNGKIVKIDCGGALTYRARGKLKSNFGDKVGEITSLLRQDVGNYYYNNMSQIALINSFTKVASISDNAISEVVSDPTLKTILINRKNYMTKILEKIKITPKLANETTLSYIERIVSLIN